MDPAGDYFFHYTTREAAFERIVPNGQLRLSPYEYMRDPLENKRWAFAGSWRPSAGEEWAGGGDVAQSTWTEFHQHVNEIRQSAKLLALTVDADPDDVDQDTAEWFSRGWARARMWEQYAEGHAGACLVFDKQGLTEALVASLVGQNLASPYHGSVDYSAAGFRASRVSLDLSELARNYSVAVVRQWVEDHNDALFFRKSPDWRTEHEYRFVVTAPGVEYVFVDYRDALRTVIVGERFPRWQRPAARDVCAEAGVGLWHLDWAQGFPYPFPADGLYREYVERGRRYRMDAWSNRGVTRSPHHE